MFPLPFVGASPYSYSILAEQVSIKLVVFAHVPTAIIGLAFAIFLYRRTKQLSTFYLLLTAIAFSFWSYFGLLAWTGTAQTIMFGWSVLDMYNITFTTLSLWFFYAFVTNTDLPMKYKVGSSIFLLPVLGYTILSENMTEYVNNYQQAIESVYTPWYINSVNFFFLLVILVFTTVQYRKATDDTTRKRVFLGGIGTALCIATVAFSFLITNVLLYFNIGTSGAAYNAVLYALFGMPFLVGFLGYLIAKYQAFDIKLLKSVGLIIILQFLLFITIFI